jgi:hypothetical protein
MLIPERTCITRIHPLQCTASFPDATLFDAATVGINFLNQHCFTDLVPLVDLGDTRIAREALTKAIDVAADPASYLYMLGPHPALLFRIMEWVWNTDNSELKRFTLRLIEKRAIGIRLKYSGTAFQFLWKAVPVASKLPQHKYEYSPVSPNEVADTNYIWLKSRGDGKAEALLRYMMLNHNMQVPKNIAVRKGGLKEVVILYHDGSSPDGPAKDSRFQATLSVAKQFIIEGNTVLLISWPGHGIGFINGILYAGSSDEKSLAYAVSSLGPVDMLISMSPNDGSDIICSRQYLNIQGKSDEPASPEWLLDTFLSDTCKATLLDIVVSSSVKVSRIRMNLWFCRHPAQIKHRLLWIIASVGYIVVGYIRYTIIRTIMANALRKIKHNSPQNSQRASD